MSPMPALKLKKTSIVVRMAVVVGGLILLAVAGYFLLVGPKKHEAKSLSNDITELNSEITQARSQATQAAGLSKILVADYNKLQTAMPGSPQIDELSLQLFSVAQAAGVRFDSITPGTITDTSTYEVIPIALVFQGNFYELSNFLFRLQSLVLVENHKLSANGRLFTVDQISFSQGEGGFPKIAATLQVDAYSFGTSGTTGSAGTSTSTSTSETTTTSGTTTTSESLTTSASAASEGATTLPTGGN